MKTSPPRRGLPVVVLASGLVVGCAVFQTPQRPKHHDMAVLRCGVPRDRVLAELGHPVQTQERNGAQVDVFAFKQGADGAGTPRLIDLVGLPGETQGTDVKVEVQYDLANKVDRVVVLEGPDAVHPAEMFNYAEDPTAFQPDLYVSEKGEITTE